MGIRIQASLVGQNTDDLKIFLFGKTIKDINYGACNSTVYANKNEEIGGVFIYFDDGSSLYITQETEMDRNDNPLLLDFTRS